MHQDPQERPHAHPELVPPPEPDAPAPDAADATDAKGEGLDLLTIGLVVFFLALIVTVAALLILPAIL